MMRHLNPAKGKAPATDNGPLMDPHLEPGRDDATRVDPHLDSEWRMRLTGIHIRNQEKIWRSTYESSKKKTPEASIARHMDPHP
jgi:hypothetical protein